jgi:hypothetical protein
MLTLRYTGEFLNQERIVTGEWRRLHSQEIHNSYPHVTVIIKKHDLKSRKQALKKKRCIKIYL